MNKQELINGLNSLKFEMVHGFLPPDYLQSSNCIYQYSCGYNGTIFKNNICYIKLSLYGVFHIFDESTEAIVLWIKSENKETVEEAIERAGTKAGNKGFDVATGAIEMVNLLRSI